MYGLDSWGEVCLVVRTRWRKQCRERWRGSLSPTITYRDWTPQEDALLRQLHAQHGNRWVEIHKSFPWRTAFQVKTRMQTLTRSKARDQQIIWNRSLEKKLDQIVRRGDHRSFEELKRHLPRGLQGASFECLLEHCSALEKFIS